MAGFRNVWSLKYAENKIIHELLTSRLVYCNRVQNSSLRNLQLTQNADAHLLTETWRRQDFTPVLASLLTSC